MSADAAFRHRDVDGVLEYWHPDGVLKPLSSDRTFRGHDEIRAFLEDVLERFPKNRFIVETALQERNVGIIFGKYATDGEAKADSGAYWIAEARDGQLLAWVGHRNVGEAFAEFRARVAARAAAES
jgi:ketosteroid isomerase-like protein